MANTVPSGRRSSGPISRVLASARGTMVLPALIHCLDVSFSACVPLLVSTVSTVPSGSKAQPSSLLLSALPVPMTVQVKVLAFKTACWLLQQLPSRNAPLLKIMPEASPMLPHWLPLGARTVAQVLVEGV